MGSVRQVRMASLHSPCEWRAGEVSSGGKVGGVMAAFGAQPLRCCHGRSASGRPPLVPVEQYDVDIIAPFMPNGLARSVPPINSHTESNSDCRAECWGSLPLRVGCLATPGSVNIRIPRSSVAYSTFASNDRGRWECQCWSGGVRALAVRRGSAARRIERAFFFERTGSCPRAAALMASQVETGR